MQLGARWAVGHAPHRGVPPELHATIAATEAEFPAGKSWTLTWLEGRPRCALEDLVLVGLDAGGAITITRSGAAGSEGSSPTGAEHSRAGEDDEDDDDDWLS